MVWATKGAEKFPLITLQRYPGKIISIFTDSLWKIYFRNPEISKDAQTYYSKLIYQILLFLSTQEEETLTISTDKDIYQEKEVVNFFVNINTEEKIDDINVRVTGKKGEIKDISYVRDIVLNNRYEGKFEIPEEGNYKIDVEAIKEDKVFFKNSKLFYAIPSSIEFEKTGLNKELLKSISEKTGGKYYDFTNYKEIKKDISSRKDKFIEKEKIKIRETPAFLIAILVLLIFEWYLRRRFGIL